MVNQSKLRFLLDTNIAIQLEEVNPETGEIRPSFRRLLELCLKHFVSLFHHPASKTDLERDEDPVRQKEMLSRLKKYPELTSPPLGEPGELEELFDGITKVNDLTDCQLLFATYRNCTDYLITDDLKIHKRAKKAQINDRVLTADEAVNLLLRLFEPEEVTLPNVEEKFVYELDINDDFFSSLKGDYPEFSEWFAEMQRNHEKAWVIPVNGEIAAICIYQDRSTDVPAYLPKRKTVLKACTFKVRDDFTGNKLGELLLKTLFNYCIANSFELVYITTFEKQENLIYVLKDFGFQVAAQTKGKGELIFFKTFHEPPQDHPRFADPLSFHTKWTPFFYDDPSIDKFVVPIYPHYHDILFPEIRPQVPLIEDGSLGTPGNTIKKAYLSHSPTRVLPRGSLLLFYRTSPDQKITTLGIVEETRRFQDPTSILRMVGKRSVYSMEEIQKMAQAEVLIIRFRLIRHLPKAWRYQELKQAGILNGYPQSIVKLTHDRYLKLGITN